LALGLAGLLAKLGVSQDEALALLREIATEAGDNEWRDRERALKDSFNKLWRGEQIIGFRRLEEIVGEETAKLIATILPPRKTEGETTSSNFGNSSKRQIGLLTLSEWDERLAHLSQGSWFVEGLLRAGWLLVINARPKVGKSIVSVNLALALAEGKSFLNLPTSPCAVLYIDLERPLETLNRFKTLNAQDNPNIFVPEERMGADMLETLQELIRQAKERTNRDVVVFVDTLGDFIKPALRQRRASINDYDAIAEILQELRDLALKLGCAFVFVHHTRKALSEEPTEVDVLGSTAIAGKFDVIAHLQPDKTDAGVLALTAEGNAIAKTTLHFALKDLRLEICEAPAKTKEEEAARFILEELKRHPEGLPRCEIERRILERGMETTPSGAQSLVRRAVDELRGRVVTVKVGRNTIYRLQEQPSLPMSRSEQPLRGSTERLPKGLTEGQEGLQASDTYISDVGFVGNSEPNSDISDMSGMSESQNDASEGRGRLWSLVTYIEFDQNDQSRAMDDIGHFGHPSFSNDDHDDQDDQSHVTNVTQHWSLWSNTIGMTDDQCRVTDVTSDWRRDFIASDIPILPELVSFGDPPEQVSHANPTKPCQYTETYVSCPQSPEISEPTYSTLRNEELIDTELLISELDELCVELPAQPEQPTLPEKPTLSEQPTQPNPSSPKPSLPDRPLPDHLACLCGSELRLFGKTYKCLRCDSPRPAVCRRCGKALKFVAENRAECIGCDALYVFDRARRLWLCDEDTF
jgi:hypothetical protein